MLLCRSNIKEACRIIFQSQAGRWYEIEESGGRFFVLSGLENTAIDDLQKVCMKLCIALGTDLGYFLNLPLFELNETVRVFLEVKKEKNV